MQFGHRVNAVGNQKESLSVCNTFRSPYALEQVTDRRQTIRYAMVNFTGWSERSLGK